MHDHLARLYYFLIISHFSSRFIYPTVLPVLFSACELCGPLTGRRLTHCTPSVRLSVCSTTSLWPTEQRTETWNSVEL